MNPNFINFSYLVASVLFILGLKGLTHPRTAVRGNLLGSLGMLLAVVVTLLDRAIVDFPTILVGLVLGSAIGALLALRIQMTAMPQLVALFNGLGGGASVLVAGAALVMAAEPGVQFAVSTALSGFIGGITFWGSLVAFAKLQEWISGNPLLIPGRQVINALLVLGTLALGAALAMEPAHTDLFWLLVVLASVLGLILVVAIGGADMPVVIALLNSCSGLAASATGFVLGNNVLIIAGSLVGASGLILTQIMCRAMNRSLANVLFGGVGSTAASSGDDGYEGQIKSTSAAEVAMLFDVARRVVIVPGYGMAVAQAQHAVHELTKLLESRSVEVEFAIHPVAGRMPGHMNVLLAEAEVPYDKLVEMERINPSFEQTDVVLVIGANDVVNPLARTDPQSPIAGMPILDVDKARTVVVIKRSLSPGFAGIPNPLFAADNALMYFGSAKEAVLDLVAALKES
ncbi:MAG: NAD synthetase [Candidatus Latescibacteria bacterium]|nr:NAD synthetase [Candidatus Latescibacterota bacterium]